jgi:hypothetical protein
MERGRHGVSAPMVAREPIPELVFHGVSVDPHQIERTKRIAERVWRWNRRESLMLLMNALLQTYFLCYKWLFRLLR